VRKLVDETQGALHVESSAALESRPKLTPEDPQDEPENLALWNSYCQAPEQKALQDAECAWVVPFLPGIPVGDLQLVYDEALEMHPRYDAVLPDSARTALEGWARVKPAQYQKLSDEPWGVQVRFAGVEFLHPEYKFKAHLSPIKYLYYVAIQARLWSRALKFARDATFKNSLTLNLVEQENPLMLPSQFAIHMAVISSDDHLLLRQRTTYTELYPGAWEAGIGEFMHGKDQSQSFPHFGTDGRPDLSLFLKNAVSEELGFDDAHEEDFHLYGFAVEYRTLAPKLLVVYRSSVDIQYLIERAKSAKDKAPKMNRIKLVPEEIVRAATSLEYPTWGPTSKLAMVLALIENRDESIKSELLEQIGRCLALVRARSSSDANKLIVTSE
jgi:hypothetical protein